MRRVCESKAARLGCGTKKAVTSVSACSPRGTITALFFDSVKAHGTNMGPGQISASHLSGIMVYLSTRANLRFGLVFEIHCCTLR